MTANMTAIPARSVFLNYRIEILKDRYRASKDLKIGFINSAGWNDHQLTVWRYLEKRIVT